MSQGLSHAEVAADVATCSGAMLVGGVDTGKTTLARKIMSSALSRGRSVAYVDADIGNSSVGPPACVGLRILRDRNDLDTFEIADRLHFVGALTPERHVLQEVIATAAMVAVGREEADLVLIDTTAAVSGVSGETLKYHKMELCRPERVIALQRGSELEPLVGMLGRFFSVDLTVLATDPDVVPTGPEDRTARRTERFRRAFDPPLDRWRVRPTVFAPTLPVGLDLARLDRMLVGIQDGHGRCLGLGLLEHGDGILRVATNAGEGMQGLRLGSLRMDPQTFQCQPVNLREIMFGV